MSSQLRPGNSYFEEVRALHPEWSDEQVIVGICAGLLDDAEALPPVNELILASLCGIAEVREVAQEHAGMLACVDGRLVATVNALDGRDRRRFTVLHEAGHTLLPGFDRETVHHRCAGPANREERLADLAAAELLLPRRFFVPDIAVCGPSLADVAELAARYQASIQATALRMVALWHRSAALLAFKLATKPTRPSDAPAPRLQWGYTGGGAWPAYLPHKSVPGGSAVGRALDGEVVDETADVDELFARSPGVQRVQARRFGATCLVLLTAPGS